MQKELKNITSETFKKYGQVIEHDIKDENNFQIVLRENENVGWRIAISRVLNKSFNKFGKHPTSMESFEPVQGIAVMCVALPESPEDFEAFLLDKPVCLFKNIWHTTVTLSACSIIKITENLNVTADSYEFPEEFKIFVG